MILQHPAIHRRGVGDGPHLAPVPDIRLEAKHRLIGGQCASERFESEHLPANAVDDVEWRATALGTNRDQRSPRCWRAGIDRARQRTNGWRFEQLGDAQPDAEFVLDTREQSDGQQRVAAHVEEVILWSDVAKLQYLKPQVAKPSLGLRHNLRSNGGYRLLADVRQPMTIHLAMRVERKLVEPLIDGRDHHLGQPIANKRSQIGRGRSLSVLVPNQERDQPGVLTGSTNDGGGGANRRVCEQRGFDLAWLNPNAAQLELVVEPPGKLEQAFFAPAHPIPCAVEPRIGFERVRHETLRCQVRGVEIAKRQTFAADEQLAGNTSRQEFPPVVQNEDFGVANRRPNGHRPVLCIPPGPLVHRRVDAGFSWSVDVVDPGRNPRGQSRRQCGRKHLAAHENVLE